MHPSFLDSYVICMIFRTLVTALSLGVSQQACDYVWEFHSQYPITGSKLFEWKCHLRVSERVMWQDFDMEAWYLLEK